MQLVRVAQFLEPRSGAVAMSCREISETNRTAEPQRVLLISYAFPPAGGGGVQRPVKFARYLPQYGWRPTILTVANPSVPVRDAALLEELDSSLQIVRARTWEPGYEAKRRVAEPAGGGGAIVRSWIRRQAVRLLQPDPQVLWNVPASRAATRVLRQQEHAAILVTGPPFSSFLLAARLKKQSGLPLILDFRDEWTMIRRYLENQAAGADGERQQRMMLRTLATADAVITTTQASAEELDRCCRAAGSRATVTCIYNGFDPPDLRALVPEDRLPDKLRIVYTGTLWRLTDVSPLVTAVEMLAQRAPEKLQRLELVFAGRRTAEQDAILDRLQPTGVCLHRRDYLPHNRALQLAASADILCLLLADAPGAERVVPGKVFEYMALRRPVLAVLPSGETQQLIAELPQAHRFHPRQPASIADWLSAQLAEHKQLSDVQKVSEAGPVGRDTHGAAISRFSRPELARQLAKVLDSATRSRGL